MAKGGARDGAGRKSKAEELGLKATLDQVFTDKDKEELFSKLLKEGKKGSLPHAQLLLAYYYGKPKETVISEIDQETTIRVVRDAGNTNTSTDTTQESAENT